MGTGTIRRRRRRIFLPRRRSSPRVTSGAYFSRACPSTATTPRARRRRERRTARGADDRGTAGTGTGYPGTGMGYPGTGDENSATAPLLDDASFEDEEAPFDALAEDDDDDGFVLPAGRTREGEMSLYRAAVCATFATTLTVFPAVTARCAALATAPRVPPCVPDPRDSPGCSATSGCRLCFCCSTSGICAGGARRTRGRERPRALARRRRRRRRESPLIPPLLACNVVVADRWRFPR